MDTLFSPSNNTQQFHCFDGKIEGHNLEWLEQHGPISESLAPNWLRQLIEILDQVHQKYLSIEILNRPTSWWAQWAASIDWFWQRQGDNRYLLKSKYGLDITQIISAGYTPPEQVNGRALLQSDFYARAHLRLFADGTPRLPFSRLANR